MFKLICAVMIVSAILAFLTMKKYTPEAENNSHLKDRTNQIVNMLCGLPFSHGS